ncbi:hypothetical protein BGZ75_000356, partial [Mortierella antarctica]
MGHAIDLATSLGLSSEGMREDLVERIRNHIATSGNSALRAQIRDDSPDISTRRTTTTTTTVKTPSSTSKSSSPIKKPKKTVTVDDDDDLDNLEDEHPLQEHNVRQFMEHMQGELHQASHLAHQLEDTLHAKVTTGNLAAGRDTVTTTTRFGNRHYADGQDDDQEGDGGRIRRRRESHNDHTGHRPHSRHHRHQPGFAGWCRHIAGKLQHCVYDCKAIMIVSRCARRQCSKVQE